MAGRRRLHFAGIALASLAILLQSVGPAFASPAQALQAEDPPTPRFEVAPCSQVFPDETDIPQWESEASPLATRLGVLPPGANSLVLFSYVTCGWVDVPLRHSNPQGKRIQLAVLILPATGSSPAPDPLFWAQGGPGGSTVTSFKWLAHDTPLRADRDMVLFDQRGTGHSIPSLDCPEWDKAGVSAAMNDLTPQEADDIELYGVSACRRRLQAAGAVLSDFNTRENAADVEDIRLALGYDKINLYGVSYGTELALNVMRSFSGSLRSVILDSVVPPQVNVETEAYRSFDYALTEFFKTCRADYKCRQAYPNLEQTYLALAARLKAEPVAIRVVDPDEQRGYEIDLTAHLLNNLLFHTFYQAEYNIPVLPALIEDLSGGARELMSGILGEYEDSFAEGMYFSTSCADGFDLHATDLQFVDIRGSLAESSAGYARRMDRICDEWKVTDLGPALDSPVRSDVPTLLVSGRYDPITPTYYAEMVAETLPNSVLVEFPNIGHGVVASSECADQVFSRFLWYPTSYVDTSCVASIPGFDFVDSAELVPLSWTGLLMGYFEAKLGSRLIVFLSLAALGVMLVVAPMWAVSSVGADSRRARRLARKILRRWSRARNSGSWWARNVDRFALANFAALLFVMVALGASVDTAYFRPAVAADAWWLWIALAAQGILAIGLAVGTWSGLRFGAWRRRRRVVAVMVSTSAAILFLVMLGGFLGILAP